MMWSLDGCFFNIEAFSSRMDCDKLMQNVDNQPVRKIALDYYY